MMGKTRTRFYFHMTSAKPNLTEWTIDQVRYQEWLATPKALRTPKTVDLLAKELGTSRVSLWEWSKKPGWNQAVAQLARDYLHTDAPSILQALGKKAMRGDVPAIKLALEVLGEYTPKQDLNMSGDLNVNISDLRNMSDDDLQSIVTG
jgi:hypothetical protein